MALTAQQIAANWQRGLANSGEKIKAGVMGVTEAPSQRAIRAIDRQVAGVQRAAADGTTAAGLQRVSLSDWQNSFVTKGLPRIATGATAAQPKFADFMTKFMPAVEAAKASLPPRGDLEQNLQRATSMARALHNFKYRP